MKSSEVVYYLRMLQHDLPKITDNVDVLGEAIDLAVENIHRVQDTESYIRDHIAAESLPSRKLAYIKCLAALEEINPDHKDQDDESL